MTAVIVPGEGSKLKEKMITNYCKDKMAGYKRPKKIIFIKDEDMPRTATGKILHRVLRERFNKVVENFE